mmetsp:Transcript_99575/g.321039  ORF Transcript_99575/g.321039 Transcript_99575/m.321039 type:complete len:84 (+) Transcript_99575:1947-2198(+)
MLLSFHRLHRRRGASCSRESGELRLPNALDDGVDVVDVASSLRHVLDPSALLDRASAVRWGLFGACDAPLQPWDQTASSLATP